VKLGGDAMTTDTSEKGLESLIVRAMTGRVDLLGIRARETWSFCT
jgi:hypothetical protein